MRKNLWIAFPAAALYLSLTPQTVLAQKNAHSTSPTLAALAGIQPAGTEEISSANSGGEAAAAVQPASETSASTSVAAADDASSTTPVKISGTAPASEQAPVDTTQLIQEMAREMAAMKARMALMESALKARAGEDSPVAEQDASALRAAEGSVTTASVAAAGQASSATAPATAVAPAALAPQVSSLPGGATLNYMLDGYYEYNFNRPPGRANDLRAYDVLGNVFSINQADLVFALDPDLTTKRRYGVRLDLQFGQATETLQGNPVNEPRPDIYRNIFQAYGTYVVPVGRGLNVDFGKWASSLGAEGNYTKDQIITRGLSTSTICPSTILGCAPLIT